MTHTVSGYGTVTTADSVTVSVTDNEPAVEVSFGASTYTVVEGGTVTVAVTLDVDPERTVVVPITVTNQGGATNVDYSGVPPDVTFNSGDTSQTVTITATDDSVDDGGESIKLAFGTLPTKVTAGSPDETTVSITDNDVAGVTVNPTTVTVAEGGTATYQVKLNTLPAGTVTVTINDPTDNTVVTADTPSLSFDSTNWDTFQDVTVRAAEDDDDDDDTATVTHTVSGYGTVTTADSVTVSVTDNEPAVEVSFGASTYTVVEGGTVTVAVTLDVDPERTVVVPITVTDQGGASAADYSRVPPNVTFSSGETSKTFTFTATNDSGVDGGESIKLAFGTLPKKVTEGSTDETTVSITDNDVAGVTVNPTTVTVAEGGTATYQVKLNTLPAGTVTVTINDPTDNTDVTAVTVSLSFDSTNWDTFQDVTVRAAEDGDAEDDTATVTHTVSGYGTVTTADSVTVSVTDNEPAVEVSFGASTYTVVEGGTVTVAVTLDVDPEHGGGPDHGHEPGRRLGGGLLPSAPERHVQQRGNFEDLHLHGHGRQRRRRRRVHQAGLRHPAHEGDRGQPRRDDGVHHRQRRRRGDGEPHHGDGGRGRDRHLPGEAEHAAHGHGHRHDQRSHGQHRRDGRHPQPELRQHQLELVPGRDRACGGGRRRRRRHGHGDPHGERLWHGDDGRQRDRERDGQRARGRGQLRGLDLHGGGGRHGDGGGDPGRGPRADGGGPDHGHEPGRAPRRPTTPLCPRTSRSAAGKLRRPSPSRPRTTAASTAANPSSWASAPSPRR